MKSLRYAGYTGANSGMGEAARNIVCGFVAAGAEVTVQEVPNIPSISPLGSSYELCRSLESRNIDYSIKFLHTTPINIHSLMESRKYHIFHLFWETTRIPDWWVWELNHSVDEVWTGSQWNRQAFINSGVKVPVWVCPQPIPPPPKSIGVARLPYDKAFTFLSIFQWTERKDPRSLIRAYLEEFQSAENVVLVIKTYKERFSEEEAQEIIRQIRLWKDEAKKDGFYYLPRIYVIPDSLSKDQVWRLYNSTDCFISAHRGEGYGLPIGEAMALGKPVISTNLGGIHEHIPKDLWYPVDYEMEHVHNMPQIPWYEEEQMWGKVSIDSLRKQMRKVFENQGEAKNKGRQAKEFIERELSFKTIGDRMVKEIEKI